MSVFWLLIKYSFLYNFVIPYSDSWYMNVFLTQHSNGAGLLQVIVANFIGGFIPLITMFSGGFWLQKLFKRKVNIKYKGASLVVFFVVLKRFSGLTSFFIGLFGGSVRLGVLLIIAKLIFEPMIIYTIIVW